MKKLKKCFFNRFSVTEEPEATSKKSKLREGFDSELLKGIRELIKNSEEAVRNLGNDKGFRNTNFGDFNQKLKTHRIKSEKIKNLIINIQIKKVDNLLMNEYSESLLKLTTRIDSLENDQSSMRSNKSSKRSKF